MDDRTAAQWTGWPSSEPIGYVSGEYVPFTVEHTTPRLSIPVVIAISALAGIGGGAIVAVVGFWILRGFG